MENIILLHGALGTSEDMSELISELAKQGGKVYAFDFSSRGSAKVLQGFGITQFTNELFEFISEQNIKSPTIFGYSMGGYVALSLASQQPWIIKGIVTLGTKFDWNPTFVSKEVQSLNADFLIKNAPGFVGSLQKKHGENWVNLLHKTTEMMKEIGTKNEAFQKQLKKISIPVRIGRGEKDHMVGNEEVVAIQKLMRNSTLFELAATKHAFETVNPSILAKIISDFIQLITKVLS